MLYENVQSVNEPVPVELETLPDGNKMVRLHRNVVKVVIPGEGEDKSTRAYLCTEVVFPLPYGRDETISSITAEFADWWAYGAAHNPKDDLPLTTEQRVDALELMMTAILSL